MSGESFDVVVVGSGFGGSVSAYRLAEAGLSVCLLERGKAYGPGDFARTPHAMAKSFWDPSAGLQGLFNIWSFRHFEAVVSAGLGGGSLIYANVFLRKDERWFEQDGRPWPVTRAELDPHYDAVERIIAPQRYPFDRAPYAQTPKTVAMQAAAEQVGVHWELPPLAVSFADGDRPPVPGEPITEAVRNLHDRTRYTCRLVGECDVGCNYGAKNSLDFTYLTLAQRLHGAEIRTRCEVRDLIPQGSGFTVTYVEHLDSNEGRPTDTSQLPLRRITARQVVLSAGALGSPYLLLRNRERHLPGLSAALGQRFSGNGDLLTFATKTRRDGAARPIEPSVGPVISSTIRVDDTRDGGDGPGFYVQEGGYPAFASWLVQTSDIGGELSRAARFAGSRIWELMTDRHDSDVGAELSTILGATERSTCVLPMLGMGRDTPGSEMTLEDGRLEVGWQLDASRPYFDRVRTCMRQLAEALGGDWSENPLWRVGRVITVHPLGGCAMGEGPDDGVVDDHGAVFGYPGLYVADGSVMPGPVGANPSFTIAALADRTADRVIADHQGASA